KKLDVEHRVYSFKKLYGHTIDEIAEAAKEKGNPFICSYCGILRRKALNIAARELGAAKLATAHNLDDEVQSMVMNLLRGDLTRMSKNEFDSGKDDGSLIPRVKPLCEIPEREAALYAFLKKIKLQSFPCSYLETSLRSDVRRFLNMMDEKHPGMKFTIYRSFAKIQLHLTYSEERSLTRCGVCGEPTTSEICMACQTLKDLNLT
ncbi:MAG: TIGR00269 family protein, partial [Candidatus Bathyarchaeota archaeon]